MFFWSYIVKYNYIIMLLYFYIKHILTLQYINIIIWYINLKNVNFLIFYSLIQLEIKFNIVNINLI